MKMYSIVSLAGCALAGVLSVGCAAVPRNSASGSSQVPPLLLASNQFQLSLGWRYRGAAGDSAQLNQVLSNHLGLELVHTRLPVEMRDIDKDGWQFDLRRSLLVRRFTSKIASDHVLETDIRTGRNAVRTKDADRIKDRNRCRCNGPGLRDADRDPVGGMQP